MPTYTLRTQGYLSRGAAFEIHQQSWLTDGASAWTFYAVRVLDRSLARGRIGALVQLDTVRDVGAVVVVGVTGLEEPGRSRDRARATMSGMTYDDPDDEEDVPVAAHGNGGRPVIAAGIHEAGGAGGILAVSGPVARLHQLASDAVAMALPKPQRGVGFLLAHHRVAVDVKTAIANVRRHGR
jgi:hypothetical protein